MASHKLTSYKHSCINKPKEPTTNKTFSLNGKCINKDDKLEEHLTYSQDNLFRILEAANGDLAAASSILDKKLNATNKLIQDLMDSSKSLSDDEFFNKLTKLKDEHKVTLDMCEKLYAMTHRGDTNDEDKHQRKPGHTVTFEDTYREDTRRSSDFVRESILELERQVTLDDLESSAQPLDLSSSFSKPPLPRSHKQDVRRSRATVDAWEAEQPVWAPDSDNNSLNPDYEDEDEAAVKQHYQELLRSKVKAMWNDFKTDKSSKANLRTLDRSPPRARSGSLDRSWSKVDRDVSNSLRQSGPLAATENWKHRVTIPQPFTMTMKEETMDERKKSRSQMLFEREQREREIKEEEECMTRFKANPIPAHVYMPLFDEINEKQESRRRFIKQYSKEILKSQEKPFTFTQRQNEFKKQKKEKLNEGDKVKDYQRSTHGERMETFVKAKPVPKSTFADKSQRLREDEVLRQIKIKMRAEEMLRKSSAPQGMVERQKKQEERRNSNLRTNLKKARARSADGRRRARDPPDFAQMHKEFELEMLHKQAGVKVTYPEPFNLRTEKRGEINQKRFIDTEEKRKDAKSTRTVYDYSSAYPDSEPKEIPESLYLYEHAAPTRLTRKDMLLDSSRRESREHQNRSKKMELMTERQRERRRREVAESLRKSAEFNSHRGPSIEEMTRSKLDNQRRLEEDYKQRLEELNQKMKERDLLIVQQQKLMAKQKAEAQYKKTLTNAGVDPQQVDYKSRDCRDSDILAYTDAITDPELTTVTSTDADHYHYDDDHHMNERQFGAPSPIFEH